MSAGTCGCCLAPAEATPENEGYSSCCNDRIAYGREAEQLRKVAEWEARGATTWIGFPAGVRTWMARMPDGSEHVIGEAA